MHKECEHKDDEITEPVKALLLLKLAHIIAHLA